MATVKTKPTSAGRRFVVKVVDAELHMGRPHMPLVESKKRKSGRNNAGCMTVRIMVGRHMRAYRIIDIRCDKDGSPARVERLEYDPNRSANIALLLYSDGPRRYIMATTGMSSGDELMSGPEAPIR